MNRLFECCTGYEAIEVLGKNWCVPATACCAAAPPHRRAKRRPTPHALLARCSRFLQFRGAFATKRHPLVDIAVTSGIRRAMSEVRAAGRRGGRSAAAATETPNRRRVAAAC